MVSSNSTAAFSAQYQAFLQQPDLFEQQENALYTSFSTHSPLPLTAAIIQHWQTVISPRLVLGKRVEYFMHYYLQQQQHLEILTHNLQIIHEKQTIGELDFLYYNKEEQQSYHLEQVYKFYIYFPTATSTDLESWIGPNNKDSLVQKLKKLKNRQFPLLHHSATQAILHQKGLSIPTMLPQLSFKAALFTPWGTPFPTTSSLNPACWKGYWLTWTMFLQENWTSTQFFIPPKQDWGRLPSSSTTWLSAATAIPIIEQWLARQKAPLCWIKMNTGAYLQLFILWW
ncbi:MAG: DUF1853 family protein [Aureispira sp.]